MKAPAGWAFQAAAIRPIAASISISATTRLRRIVCVDRANAATRARRGGTTTRTVAESAIRTTWWAPCAIALLCLGCAPRAEVRSAAAALHATDVIEQLCGGARYPKLAELDRRIKYLQCWIHEYEQTAALRKLDGAPATLTVLRDMLAVYERLRDREITVDDANQRLEALEAELDRAGDR